MMHKFITFEIKYVSKVHEYWCFRIYKSKLDFEISMVHKCTHEVDFDVESYQIQKQIKGWID